MTERQKEIIKEWEKTKVVHPTYGEIARKVGTGKSYVYKTVQEYQTDKKALLKGK